MSHEMTLRQRCREALLFGQPDRIPLNPGGGRKSTREAWRRQGLPEDVEPGTIAEYAYRQAGGTLPWPEATPGFSVNQRMVPEFEEKVIERRAESQIVQDWKGNVCEISNEFSLEYLRNAIDFVTRRWVKCPVEDWDDWEDMKRRYDTDEAGRLPDDPEQAGKAAVDGQGFVQISFHGPLRIAKVPRIS